MKQLKSSTDTRISVTDFVGASAKILSEIRQEENVNIRKRGQAELAKVEASCRNIEEGKLKPVRKIKSNRSDRSNKSDRSERRKKFKGEKIIKYQALNEGNGERSLVTQKSLYDNEEDCAEEEPSMKAAGSLYTLDDEIDEVINEEEIDEEETHQEIKRNEQNERFEEAKDVSEEEGEEGESQSASESWSSSKSTLTSLSSDDFKPQSKVKVQKTRIENHFIDVGSLFNHGIFGLGEEMKDRVIMSRTVVQCLLIPRFWLFEKKQNPGNIWERRRFYIESNIPSRQELFHNFLNTRKWQAFKTHYVESNIKDFAGNPTKKQDIPIIAHIIGNE